MLIVWNLFFTFILCDRCERNPHVMNRLLKRNTHVRLVSSTFTFDHIRCRFHPSSIAVSHSSSSHYPRVYNLCVLYMFVMENPSVVVTVVTDSPQLDRLNEDFLVWGEDTSNVVIIVIPHQCRFAHQILKNWKSFQVLQEDFTVSHRVEQFRLHTQKSVVTSVRGRPLV